MTDRILVIAVVVLALADGVLHLALDIVLFRSRFFLNDLSVLFLLNFVGYLVLAVAFMFRQRLLGRYAWLLNLALAAVAMVSIVLWLQRGGPNPMGLGYLSKVLEVWLLVAVVAEAWVAQRTRQRAIADAARVG